MASPSARRHADAVILFGATGDLAAKKLWPALFGLHRSGELVGPIVGVARSAIPEGLAARAAASVR